MDQLKKAIEFLNKRGTKTIKSDRPVIRDKVEVISLSEVSTIMTMVFDGSFEQFYNDLIKLGHPDAQS